MRPKGHCPNPGAVAKRTENGHLPWGEGDSCPRPVQAVTWAWLVYVPLCSSRKSSPTQVHSCDDSFSRTEKSWSGVEIRTLRERRMNSDEAGEKPVTPLMVHPDQKADSLGTKAPETPTQPHTACPSTSSYPPPTPRCSRCLPWRSGHSPGRD